MPLKFLRKKSEEQEIILVWLKFMILDCRWNNLRDMVDQKRDEITLAHGLQNFHIECNETIVSHLDQVYI